MIRQISHEKIREKVEKYLDSQFGTPAGDHLVFLEVGAPEAYDQGHLFRAIFLTQEELKNDAERYFLDKGVEVVIYSEGSEDPYEDALLYESALKLEAKGFQNLYIYRGGKREWMADGLGLISSNVPADDPSRARLQSAKKWEYEKREKSPERKLA